MKHLASAAVVTHPTLALQPYQLHEVLTLADRSSLVDGHCLGWVPRAQLRGIHDEGRMLSVWNNDDCVGWIAWAISRGEMRIHYTWVRLDARLIMHGRALVDHVEYIARQHRLATIGLWCAVDLAANEFWSALGFQRINWRWGRAKKSRRHWQWRRPVVTSTEALQQVEVSPSFALGQPTLPVSLPASAPEGDKAQPGPRTVLLP